MFYQLSKMTEKTTHDRDSHGTIDAHRFFSRLLGNRATEQLFGSGIVEPTIT